MPAASLTRGITYIAGCDWCGLYAFPEGYGQPKEKGIQYAHRPPEPEKPEGRSQKSEVAQAKK